MSSNTDPKLLECAYPDDYTTPTSNPLAMIKQANEFNQYKQFDLFQASQFYTIIDFYEKIFLPAIDPNCQWFNNRSSGTIAFSDSPETRTFDDRQYALLWTTHHHSIPLKADQLPSENPQGIPFTSNRSLFKHIQDAREGKGIPEFTGKQDIPDLVAHSYLLKGYVPWPRVTTLKEFRAKQYDPKGKEKLLLLCPGSVTVDPLRRLSVQAWDTGKTMPGVDIPEGLGQMIIDTALGIYRNTFPRAKARAYVSTIQVLRKGTEIAQKPHCDCSHLFDEVADELMVMYNQLPISLIIPLQYDPKCHDVEPPRKKKPKGRHRRSLKDPPASSVLCKHAHGINICIWNRFAPTIRENLDLRPPHGLLLMGNAIHAGLPHQELPDSPYLQYARLHIQIDIEPFPRLTDEVGICENADLLAAKGIKMTATMNMKSSHTYGYFREKMLQKIKVIMKHRTTNTIDQNTYEQKLRAFEFDKLIHREFVSHLLATGRVKLSPCNDLTFWKTSLLDQYRNPTSQRVAKKKPIRCADSSDSDDS